MKYKILEHKADIKIKVLGSSFEELFKNAAGAMASILYKNLKLKTRNLKRTKTLIIKSADREILLVDFLNDILGESQINKCVYNVSSLKFYDSGLQAELIGYPVERFDEDIKAATHHDLSIRQNENGNWEAIILFDV